jgi:hypothetical protein
MKNWSIGVPQLENTQPSLPPLSNPMEHKVRLAFDQSVRLPCAPLNDVPVAERAPRENSGWPQGPRLRPRLPTETTEGQKY